MFTLATPSAIVTDPNTGGIESQKIATDPILGGIELQKIATDPNWEGGDEGNPSAKPTCAEGFLWPPRPKRLLGRVG